MNNSKFKRIYVLEQQTPLLHFQSNQQGATLRASEVKPMLDRFIQEFVCGNGIKLPSSWFIKMPEGNSAAKPLNYKMSIKCSRNIDADETKENTRTNTVTKQPHMLYFGNMGRNAGKIKSLMFECKDEKGNTVNGVNLELMSFAETKASLPESLKGSGLAEKFTLLDFVDFVLPAFFALTCFGTRASKGFGSFNVKGRRLTDSYILRFDPVFYKVSYGMQKPSYTDFLNDIWMISGFMKAGFNFGEKNGKKCYYKGKAQTYFWDRNWGSEKVFIKQNVLLGNDNNKNSDQYRKYDDFRFTRAMLGLPQKYEFRASATTTRKGEVTISPGKGNEVARFASPVRFVPNGHDLFIVPKEIPNEMFDAAFELNGKTIKTPSESEFSLQEFLDWFADSFNNRENMQDLNQTFGISAVLIKSVDKFKRNNIRIEKITRKAGEGNA